MGHLPGVLPCSRKYSREGAYTIELSGRRPKKGPTSPTSLNSIPQIPDGISFDQAATVPLGLGTVVLAMYNTDPKAAGRSLLLPPCWEPEGAATFSGKPAFIIGGASSVGQYGSYLIYSMSIFACP